MPKNALFCSSRCLEMDGCIEKRRNLPLLLAVNKSIHQSVPDSHLPPHAADKASLPPVCKEALRNPGWLNIPDHSIKNTLDKLPARSASVSEPSLLALIPSSVA